MLCVFFFQAEDGIRDVAVTGVQTCALPISITSAGRERNTPSLVKELEVQLAECSAQQWEQWLAMQWAQQLGSWYNGRQIIGASVDGMSVGLKVGRTSVREAH